jgi:hypothetical protein
VRWPAVGIGASSPSGLTDPDPLKTARFLQDWLSAHPQGADGRPFYAPMGRKKTFDDGDIARIRATAMEEERVRLTPRHRGRAAPYRPARTHSDALAARMALIEQHKQQKKLAKRLR